MAANERWDRLADLFDEIVELPPDERAAAVERACAGDAALRRELERLLAADAGADDVLSPFAPLAERGRVDLGPPPVDPLGLVGVEINHYVVEAWLGAGGMGVVYRARDRRLDRAVALKLLSPEYSRDARARERLVREARAASALDHPNICTIHEVGETPEGRLYIAMAFYDGETLRDRIARGRLALVEATTFAAQIARGLDHAHGRRVIHRDIKPANLLLTRDGVVKILDFGLARSDAASLSQAHLRAGTAFYMSPEQARGEPPDARSDLWSLGVVLHEMLTGDRPFRGDDPLAALLAIQALTPTAPSAARPEVPPALDSLVRRLLAREPNDRPQNAREVENELTRIDESLARGTRSRLLPWQASSSRTSRRRWWWAGGVAAAGLLGLTIAAAAPELLPTPSLMARGLIESRERILVGDFGSQTGDSLLAAAVTEALRVDLDRSTAAQVVDRGYVAEVLGRMSRAVDTPVRGEVAREVAVRDGTKAYLDGEVSSVGRAFVLTARLVSSRDATPLVVLRETARDSAAVIEAVERLSRTLRRRMGEPLRSVRAGEPLEKITSASLAALQLYARGSHAYHVRGDPTTARDLLIEAIRLDTGFAMAYRKLGIVAYTDQETRVRSLERAYAFRDRLPPVERLFIAGTYHSQLTFNPTEAFRAYRQLLEIDPANVMAASNLALVHANLAELERAEEILRTLPNDRSPKFGNLHVVLLQQGRVAAADSVIALGTELFPEHMLLAGARYMFLIIAGRAAEADSLGRMWLSKRMAVGQRSLLLYGVGFADAVRGRAIAGDRMLAESQPMALRVASEETWALALGARVRARTLIRGEPEAALEILDAALAERPLETLPRFDRPYLPLAIAYAEAGRPETAARLLDAYEREIPRGLRGSPENRLLARGYLALARGRPRQAIDSLRMLARLPMRECRYCGGYPLGVAWERLGEPDSAITAYAAFADFPQRGFVHENLALPAVLLRLGELLEARGDTARAIEYYRRFVRLWADADAELMPRVVPVRRRLAELERARM